jgi:aminoglycoside 6'-N-acetyltransferase I
LGSRYGLQIRAAGAADAAGIAELMLAAGSPVDAAALAPRLEALQAGAGAALVAVEWGPPGGIVVLHWHPTLDDDRPVAWVSTLVVAPADRRRGIGRLLLKAASQAARLAGCGTLRLAAPPGSSDLRGFCHAAGFEEIGAVFRRSLRKKS